jgi:hypothetical protein
LQKNAEYYRLSLSDLIYDYLKEFNLVTRFDFTSRSHKNYYIVRKYWVEILGILTKSNTLSIWAKKAILENSDTAMIYREILNYTKDYKQKMRKLKTFNNLVVKFNERYFKLSKSQAETDGYVNLYDICMGMGISYNRFNTFLSEFYEVFRTKKNIFFLNIVSTIDQRKRFYVRNTPVLSIKIMDL